MKYVIFRLMRLGNHGSNKSLLTLATKTRPCHRLPSQFPVHPFIQSLVLSLTYPPIYPPFLLITHLSIYSPTSSFIPIHIPLTHPFTHLSTCSTDSLFHLPAYTSIYSSIHPSTPTHIQTEARTSTCALTYTQSSQSHLSIQYSISLYFLQ